MGDMPILRTCVRALALLFLLYATLFIGAESPVLFRGALVLTGIGLTFPADFILRLWHLMRDKRPEPKDFVFAAALDPSEGHEEPIDYTLIGTIVEVRDLNAAAGEPR